MFFCFEQNQRLNFEEIYQDKGKKNISEDSFIYVVFILIKFLKIQREREFEYDIYIKEKN